MASHLVQSLDCLLSYLLSLFLFISPWWPYVAHRFSSSLLFPTLPGLVSLTRTLFLRLPSDTSRCASRLSHSGDL